MSKEYKLEVEKREVAKSQDLKNLLDLLVKY